MNERVRKGALVAAAVVAAAGTSLAVVSIIQCTANSDRETSTVNRLARDERCLRSVVMANTARSVVLTDLGKRRSDADQARQNWNTVEQRIIGKAFGKNPPPRHVLRHAYVHANRGYLRADAHFRRLNTAYNQALQAHPVPQLKCDGGHLIAPTPTVTASATATRTAHATATRTRTVPGPPGATRTVIRTVTEPPGKRQGRRHRR